MQLGNTGFSWSDVLLGGRKGFTTASPDAFISRPPGLPRAPLPSPSLLTAVCYPPPPCRHPAAGDLPNVYVYACNNPSESIIAKRRGYGTIVSYNVPPYGRAGLYKQMAELKALLAEYREQPEASEALKGPILELLASAGLQEDCPFDGGPETAAAAASSSGRSRGGGGSSDAAAAEGKRVLLAEDAEGITTEAFTEYASRVYQYLQVGGGLVWQTGTGSLCCHVAWVVNEAQCPPSFWARQCTCLPAPDANDASSSIFTKPLCLPAPLPGCLPADC